MSDKVKAREVLVKICPDCPRFVQSVRQAILGDWSLCGIPVSSPSLCTNPLQGWSCRDTPGDHTLDYALSIYMAHIQIEKVFGTDWTLVASCSFNLLSWQGIWTWQWRMGKSGGRKASSIHYQVILRIYLRIIHLRTSFLPYQSYMEEWQMWGRRHFKKVGQVFSPLMCMWKIT